MNHVPILPQTAPTWRDSIAQDAPPRPRGRTGRKRIVADAFRHWAAMGALAACVIFGYIAWRAWNANPVSLAAPAPAAPLRDIKVRSDGVLGRAWVEHTLRIPAGAGIMDLDLPALQDRLLQSGQVRTAIVARRLPDILVVTLEERSPVLRVRAQGSDGREARLFVARDGFVFSGDNYDETFVGSLPWLAGVNLTRDLSGRGFARLDGLAAVADLLGTARSSAPSLARDFQVVSLARFARDGVILVRTPEVAEIAFGSAEGFYQQIARLDYILDELRVRSQAGAAPIRSINLAVGGRQVPVAFDPPPAAALRPPAVAPAPAVAPSRPPSRPFTSGPTFFRL